MLIGILVPHRAGDDGRARWPAPAVVLQEEPVLLKMSLPKNSNVVPEVTGTNVASKYTSNVELNVPPVPAALAEMVIVPVLALLGSSVSNTSKKLPPTSTGAVLSSDRATS